MNLMGLISKNSIIIKKNGFNKDILGIYIGLLSKI